MKTSLDWFKHESGASDSPKFVALRASPYGWAGEGRFWALNCLIAQAGDCRLDLRRKFLKPTIATKLGLTLGDLEAFLVALRDDFDLVHYEDGVLWTERTQEDLAALIPAREAAKERRERKKPRVALPSPDECKKTGDERQTSPDAAHRVEESRVEESREEEKPVFVPVKESPPESAREDGMARIERLRAAWNDEWSLKECKRDAMHMYEDERSPALQCLSAYSDAEILAAMKNYVTVGERKDLIRFPEYQGFYGFLKKGVENYMDLAKAIAGCKPKPKEDRPKPAIEDRKEAWGAREIAEVQAQMATERTPEEEAEMERMASEARERFRI
jgi:hypothetical protein